MSRLRTLAFLSGLILCTGLAAATTPPMAGSDAVAVPAAARAVDPAAAKAPDSAAALANPRAAQAEADRARSTLLLVWISAGFGLVASLLLVMALFFDRHEQFQLRRHWGGFGGSVSGWGLSRGLVLVVCALTLGLVSGGLAMRALDLLDPEGAARQGAAGSAAGARASDSSR